MANRILSLLVLAGTVWMANTGRSQIVANGSFEQPGYASDEYTTPYETLATNGVTNWSFGPSGVTGQNYDGITTSEPGSLCSGNVEDGTNAAFLEGGFLSQNVTLNAGSYTLSFWAMGLVDEGDGANPVAVTVGSVLSSTVTPPNTAQNVLSDWTQYLFNFDAPSNGAYLLTFQATIPYGPTDHTTFIDNVSIVSGAVPPFFTSEPAPGEMLYVGGTARFSAQANGAPAPSYQWQIESNGVFVKLNNSSRISGASGTTLAIRDLVAADSTNYLLQASNSAGSTNGSTAELVVLPTPAAGSYDSAVLAAHPVAYYPLNETNDPSTGTAVAYDYVGAFNGVYGTEAQNGYDGVAGPLPANGFPDFPTNDYAALFTSPDGEITLAPWELNTNTVTFTAWINPSGPQNPYGGLIYVVGPTDGLGFNYTGSTDVNGNQTLGYSWDYDPNTYGWNSGITPPPGQWSLVALVVTSSNATVYVLNTNGILSSTHTYNHEAQPFSATPVLGSLSSQPNNGAYNGSMDHVAIFNQALTEVQLVDLYGGASGVSGLAPGITGEPLPQQTLFAGQSVQFSAQASGYPPPSYQWQIETNGIYVNLTNGGRISGATSASLTITNLQAGDATNYLAEAFNSAGSTESAPASLTVLPAPPPGSPRAIVTVINPSFEDSQQSGDTYTTPFGSINPRTGVPGWQFSSSASNSYSGIVTETGATFGSPKYIPQGWQAAFVQGTGQFSQAVTFNTTGTYLIRFRAEGRSNAGAGAQTIILTVDGNAVGTFTPLTTQWAVYTSSEFNVNAGVHVLSFAGTVPYSQSDRSSFIDAVQIVTPAEAFAAVSPTSPVYDIIFIGDSITYGATLADPSAQASAVECRQSLGTRYNVAVRMSNQGHSGATTLDWLPESPYNPAYFQGAVAAAAALESNQPGQLVFSIMLGANDSAQSGPDGAPVSPSNFLSNLQLIVNQLVADFTNAYVFVHYPTWYSTNTETGALYGAAGLARLQTYFPEIDQLISNCAIAHPGLVFAGDKLAFGNFESNYLTEMTPVAGPQGTYYLHPNAAGAVVLGEYWANAIAAPLDFSTNDSYITWLQSADLTPGAPGTGFSDTPTNSLVSNGDSYGNPNGLIATFATNIVAVSADIRNDTNLTVVLQDSDDLINWSPLAWPIAPNQSGVATGFVRHAVLVPVDNLQQEKFYRLVLKY